MLSKFQIENLSSASLCEPWNDDTPVDEQGRNPLSKFSDYLNNAEHPTTTI